MVRMMMILAVLVCTIACGTAEECDDIVDCVVRGWSEWTGCNCATSRKCPEECPHPVTWLKNETVYDGHHLKMTEIKAEKRTQRSNEAKCIRVGSCPALRTTSEGKALCKDGKAGSYPCMNVDLISHLDIEDLGYNTSMTNDRRGWTNDMWGWTDPETKDEYALVGTTGGTSFVRVSDPNKPEVVAFLYDQHMRNNIWRDIKVVKNHAFIVAETLNHGIQIVDLTRFRKMKSFSLIQPDAWYPNVSKVHNIVSNEETDYVYVVGCRPKKSDTSTHQQHCNGGLHMIDVKDPKKPRFKGCYGADGYTHDAQCVIYRGPDNRYYGREVCFNYNENTVTIVDVTNKDKPSKISITAYNRLEAAARRYTHQGWLTEDHSIIIMNDEWDEETATEDRRTKSFIWDVSDLEKPEIKRIYYSQETAIDHNLYIKGNYVYQTNYEAGLRILEIDQADYNLKEVAYFDVYPASTQPEYRGSWSSYPYYKHGAKHVVAVTSLEFGLYIVKPNWQNIEAGRFQRAAPVEKRWRHVTPFGSKAKCPHWEESRPCKTTCLSYPGET